MQKNETSAKNRQRHNHLLVLLCSLTLMVVAVTIRTVAGRGIFEPTTEKLSVNDPRPVALAAETLEKKYGWMVTYEDPPYAYEGDLLDVTEKVSRNVDKPGQRVLIPRGGDLAFEYSIDSATKKPADSAPVIQQLLDAYAIAGNPGVFRMEQNGQRVHAKDQKAREFLSNELDRMTNDKKLSWQLLYDPCSRTYFLNIHAVQ